MRQEGGDQASDQNAARSTVSIVPRVPAASLRGSREGQEEGR
jgi:hypothetical protein